MGVVGWDGSHVGARLLSGVLQAGWGRALKRRPAHSPCLACIQGVLLCVSCMLRSVCALRLFALRAVCTKGGGGSESIPHSCSQNVCLQALHAQRSVAFVALLCGCFPCPSTSLRSAYLAVCGVCGSWAWCTVFQIVPGPAFTARGFSLRFFGVELSWHLLWDLPVCQLDCWLGRMPTGCHW